MKDNIGLIIVWYNPSANDIAFAQSIAKVYQGIIIDNSETKTISVESIGKMKYKALMHNCGIAKAQNEGIRYLSELPNIEYIVFFDQDSRYNCDFPLLLCQEYSRIKDFVPNLGILGPIIGVENTTKIDSSIFHKTNEQDGFLPMREIISSGSIVHSSILRKNGFMRECMFIDYVDFEYCWRLRNIGYICGQTTRLILNHKVGVMHKTIGPYVIQVWSPKRYYYQFRNHLWLCTLSYIPFQWKISTTIKHLARIIYFPLFIKNGYKCLIQMLLGIKSSFSDYKSFSKERTQYD